MKVKSILSIIILILAAIAVFIFGIVKIDLPPDTYAVIFTKTGGYDSKIFQAGDFRWKWENLLPTNLSYSLFDLSPRRISINSEGSLPSGDIYSIYLDGNPDFTYTFNFTIKYRINSTELPGLIKKGIIIREDIESWHNDFEKLCAVETVSYVQSKNNDSDFRSNIVSDFSALSQNIIKFLELKFDFLEIISFIPEKINFPDIDLYIKGKELYFKRIELANIINSEISAKINEDQALEASRLKILENYGEILTKFPILIDFFSIYQEKAFDLLPIMIPTEID